MPVVTAGLLKYWNAKDGLANNILRNLAPGQADHPMYNVNGVWVPADSSIRLTGINQRTELRSMAGLNLTNAWTFEYVFNMEQVVSGSYKDVYGMSGYMDMSVGETYMEYFTNNTSTYSYLIGYRNDLHNKTGLRHVTVTYDGTTIRMYWEGQEVGSKNVGTSKSFGSGQQTLMFNGQGDLGYYKVVNTVRFHAARYYNRALTAAEVATNVANGAEIGMASPLVKIGEFRAASGILLPVYSIVDNETQPLRVQTANGKGFIPIVPTTDANASKIRTRAGGVTRSLKK